MDSGGGFLRDVWRSLQTAASDAALRRALRQYLQYQGDPVFLQAIAAHLHGLLRRLGMQQGAPQEAAGSKAAESCVGVDTNQQAQGGALGLSRAVPPIKLQRRDDGVEIVGPEAFGVSAAEAAAMGSDEWAMLIQATCRSMQQAWSLDGSAKKSTKNTPRSPRSDCFNCGGESPLRVGSPARSPVNFASIAATVIKAQRMLQHAAGLLWTLPAGPRRRYLIELCAAVEQVLAPLEAVLLEVPGREFVLQVDRGEGRDTARGRGGFFSAVISRIQHAAGHLVQSWNSLPVLSREDRVVGVPEHVLVSQVQYAAALGRVWDGGELRGAVGRLEVEIAALQHAARSGMFLT